MEGVNGQGKSRLKCPDKESFNGEDAQQGRMLLRRRGSCGPPGVSLVDLQREAGCPASQRNESSGGHRHMGAGRRLFLSELQAILELKPF